MNLQQALGHAFLLKLGAPLTSAILSTVGSISLTEVSIQNGKPVTYLKLGSAGTAAALAHRLHCT